MTSFPTLLKTIAVGIGGVSGGAGSILRDGSAMPLNLEAELRPTRWVIRAKNNCR